MQNRKRDTDVWNSFLDPVGEGEGGMFQENGIETCILSRVKQITSPGWMHETSARIWCTGKTQRDQVEREVGGGIGIGNTCKSMADSFQCMTKPITIKKKSEKNKKQKTNSDFFLFNSSLFPSSHCVVSNEKKLATLSAFCLDVQVLLSIQLSDAILLYTDIYDGILGSFGYNPR